MNDDSERADAEDADPGVLGRRLDALLRRAGVSNAQAARDITSAGVKITHAYIAQLRTGVRRRPNHDKLRALADYFKVSVDYFTGPDSGFDAGEVDELMAIADSERVRTIAHHASGLSAEAQELILTMIDKARRLEGLPPAAADVHNQDDGPDADADGGDDRPDT
ncbi:MAG: helix-turn-helix domain-containing protein [Stackebrandtia sp.]